MSYKSITVHLDTSKRAHARLEIALRLARDYEAEVTAAFAVFTPVPQPMSVMAGSADYYCAHEESRAQQAGAIERLFRAELVRAEVPGRWVEAREHDEPSVSRYGRCADLVIEQARTTRVTPNRLSPITSSRISSWRAAGRCCSCHTLASFRRSEHA